MPSVPGPHPKGAAWDPHHGLHRLPIEYDALRIEIWYPHATNFESTTIRQARLSLRNIACYDGKYYSVAIR